MAKPPIRIGSRPSQLAMWQAQWVADRLAQIGAPSTVVAISTRGDKQTSGSIESIGSPGVFTKELQKALLDGRVDLSVHSLKDLPTDEIKGLALACVPLRDSPFDVLISREGVLLDHLPAKSRIGTGSLRRRCQLLYRRRDLEMHDIRGNVETRLKKLHDGHYDAIVLAEAGLNRLGLAGQITQVLPASVMLPAAGQGALAVETRSADRTTREWVERIDDMAAHQAILAERALLATLRGGCLAPVGAWGRIEDDGRLHLSANVVSVDGSVRLTADLLGNAANATTLGRQAAEQLLAEGAAELITQARKVV